MKICWMTHDDVSSTVAILLFVKLIKNKTERKASIQLRVIININNSYKYINHPTISKH